MYDASPWSGVAIWGQLFADEKREKGKGTKEKKSKAPVRELGSVMM